MIGRTLGGYFFRQFARAILAVYGTIFAVIYLVDFVEMFRRAAGMPHARAATILLLSLMRTPSISEQALPFIVLVGAMIAFVELSRKLELVIARAAGVSVWQFIGPGLFLVVLLGALSMMAVSPISAYLKQRADRIETGIFDRIETTDSNSGLWIMQNGRAGQAIIRAERSSDRGALLANVSVFRFDPTDRFTQRIDAARARLFPGYWRLRNARVIVPGKRPRSFGEYLMATNLTRAQAMQSFVPPDSVSFWELPRLGNEIKQAGLNATAYRLRFQTLLARPLLFAAMVLIAACFSLRFFRFGGVAKTAAGGVAAGFVLYVATKLVGDLGSAGLLSAPVAAWSPAIVASMLGSLVLLHQEDG